MFTENDKVYRAYWNAILYKRIGMIIDAREGLLEFINDHKDSQDSFAKRFTLKARIKLAQCEIALLNYPKAKQLLCELKQEVKETDPRTLIRYREAKCELWLRIAVPRKAIKQAQKYYEATKHLSVF